MSPKAAANVLDFNKPDTAKGVGGELATTTQALATRLSVSTITDIPSLEQAVADRQMIGDACKRIEEFFAPFKSMAHRLHKALCDRENEILGPLLRLDREKRTAIQDFRTAQDRIRQARERELAEQQRRDNEARAAAEAAHLEKAGEHQMAAAVVAEAIAAPAPVVTLQDTTRQVKGLKFTRRWLWRFAGGPNVTKDTPPVIVARTMGLIPREFLCVDEQKVGAYVRSMKDSAQIPGLDVYFVDDPTRG